MALARSSTKKNANPTQKIAAISPANPTPKAKTRIQLDLVVRTILALNQRWRSMGARRKMSIPAFLTVAPLPARVNAAKQKQRPKNRG